MILNRMPRPSVSKHRLYVSSSSQTRQSRAAETPVKLFHFLTGEQQFPIWNGCCQKRPLKPELSCANKLFGANLWSYFWQIH
jgi:hypothetical protein